MQPKNNLIMKNYYRYLLLIGLIVFFGQQGIIQAQQLAFPTAEGFGAYAMGGGSVGV